MGRVPSLRVRTQNNDGVRNIKRSKTATQITMKLSESITNLTTGVLVISVASLVAGLRQVETKIEVPDHLRSFFFFITSAIALMNLSGFPKRIMRLWDTTAFGEKFFPFPELTKAQCRVYAGGMEAMGIWLAASGTDTVQAVGFGLLMTMYARGAMIHASLHGREEFPAALFAALVAAMAGLLFIGAVQTSLSLPPEPLEQPM